MAFPWAEKVADSFISATRELDRLPFFRKPPPPKRRFSFLEAALKKMVQAEPPGPPQPPPTGPPAGISPLYAAPPVTGPPPLTTEMGPTEMAGGGLTLTPGVGLPFVQGEVSMRAAQPWEAPAVGRPVYPGEPAAAIPYQPSFLQRFKERYLMPGMFGLPAGLPELMEQGIKAPLAAMGTAWQPLAETGRMSFAQFVNLASGRGPVAVAPDMPGFEQEQAAIQEQVGPTAYTIGTQIFDPGNIYFFGPTVASLAGKALSLVGRGSKAITQAVLEAGARAAIEEAGPKLLPPKPVTAAMPIE